MGKRTSAAAIAVLVILGGVALAAADGCGALGTDAKEPAQVARHPPLSSFMPVFVQLAAQGDLGELSTLLRDFEGTGQLRDLVDALDLSIRAVGGEALKEILGKVLIDPELRTFVGNGGPLHQVLKYPQLNDVFDMLHLLSTRGVVHNGIVPLLETAVDSPLMRALKDADREVMRDGSAAAALGMIEGLAKEKVDYLVAEQGKEPATVKVPSFTPLLSMFITVTENPTLLSLAHSVVGLMTDPKIAPLFPVVGGLAGAIDADPAMARRIVANLGHGFLDVDRDQTEGLREIIQNMFIGSIAVKAPPGADPASAAVNFPDKIRILLGADGKGGERIVGLLKALGPDVIEHIGPAYSKFWGAHCQDPELDGDNEAHPTGVLDPSATECDEDPTVCAGTDKFNHRKISCFMQMIHMVNSMYGKVIDKYPEGVDPVGADLIGGAGCAEPLRPYKGIPDQDPIWENTKVTTNYGEQPTLPSFPRNILLDFHQELASRVRCKDLTGASISCDGVAPEDRRYDLARARAYVSYINCILHIHKDGYWILTGVLDWETDAVGFAVFDAVSRGYDWKNQRECALADGCPNGLELYAPLLYEMKNHPDGKNHVDDAGELIAGLWGNNGDEINSYYRVAASFFNYPDPESAFVADVTRLIDKLLGLSVSFGGESRDASRALFDALVVLNTPTAPGDPDTAPLVAKIAVPLLDLISRNIDADLEAAIPGIAATLEKPTYRAEGIFTLLASALTEQQGRVSYTDYIDAQSAHYRSGFAAEATDLVDRTVPRLHDLAQYLLTYDAEGVIAGALGYAVEKGTVKSILTLFEHLMDYDDEHRLLDFLSRLLHGGVVTTVNDMLDVVHERGLTGKTTPIFTLFCEKDVWPEFLDVVYEVLPLIKLGNLQ